MERIHSRFCRGSDPHGVCLHVLQGLILRFLGSWCAIATIYDVIHLISFEGTQLFCGKISQKSTSSDSMSDGSADMESNVSVIGSGRDVVTNLAISCAHSLIFIAHADGHCMRWTFAPSPDACGTIIIENTSELSFVSTSDFCRLGPVHNLHASPYGSFLTMTRSSQPVASLRLPRTIYIQRCNTDTEIFPVTVAVATALFIIPWNGSAALELYSTCQRTQAYWRDSLLAIWTLACQTSLPLEHAFRALQVILLETVLGFI
jgi:hypothetical protein